MHYHSIASIKAARLEVIQNCLNCSSQTYKFSGRLMQYALSNDAKCLCQAITARQYNGLNKR